MDDGYVAIYHRAENGERYVFLYATSLYARALRLPCELVHSGCNFSYFDAAIVTLEMRRNRLEDEEN